MTALPSDVTRQLQAADDSSTRIVQATKAALVNDLLRSGAIADLAHPMILALAVALVWDRMPVAMVLGWAAAVVAGTILRAVVRHYARVRQYAPDRTLRLTRLTIGALAIAWGIGAAVAAPDLPLTALALMLVLCTGLVSGAFTTLTPDPVSARLFIAGLLIPVGIGLMLNGADREHILGLTMIVTYGGFMLVQIQRAHRSLVERHRIYALLQESEDLAVRERRYMDALFESAFMSEISAIA